MTAILLKNIKKSYGSTGAETIKGVDLEIKESEFVVFVGPSGCGKSTLLRMVAGLEDITSGDLLIDGVRVNDLPPPERGIAMVFQSYALYPHMTCFENMAFGLKLSGKNQKSEIEKKVKEAAEILQITHLLDKKPKELSGGQRQRIAIGRAIVRSPKVFLFDEPLSNLDASLRVQMRIEIAKLHASMNATMIYVTHDQVEAMTLADKIVVLRAGMIEQVGSPLELYSTPVNQFVAGFIGSPSMNFIETKIAEATKSYVDIEMSDDYLLRLGFAGDGAKAGDKVVLGIRPEHISLGEGECSIDGVVDLVEHLGAESYIYITINNQTRLTVKANGNVNLNRNDKIIISFSPKDCHLFDADENAFIRL